MSPELVTGIFTAVGALVAGVISIWGIYIVNKAQRTREREQELAADQRALRDSKVTRIRSHYQVLLFTARNANLLIEQTEDYYSGRLSKDVINVFEEQWQQAARDCNVALVALSLETKDPYVLSLFREAQELFAYYLIQLLKKDIHRGNFSGKLMLPFLRNLREKDQISYLDLIDYFLGNLLQAESNNSPNIKSLIIVLKRLRQRDTLTVDELGLELKAIRFIRAGETGTPDQAMMSRLLQIAQEYDGLSDRQIIAEIEAIESLQTDEMGMPDIAFMRHLLNHVPAQGVLSYYDLLTEIEQFELHQNDRMDEPAQAVLSRLLQAAQAQGWLDYAQLLREVGVGDDMGWIGFSAMGASGMAVVERLLQIAKELGRLSYLQMLVEIEAAESLMPEQSTVSSLLQAAREHGKLTYSQMREEVEAINSVREGEMSKSEQATVDHLLRVAQNRDGLSDSQMYTEIERMDLRRARYMQNLRSMTVDLLVQMVEAERELSYQKAGSLILMNLIKEKVPDQAERATIEHLVNMAKVQGRLSYYDVSTFMNGVETNNHQRNDLWNFWKLQEVIYRLEEVARDHLAKLELPV